MVERIGSREARNRFADLLGRVGYGGEVIIVERSGKPLVAMVPLEMYEQWLAERETRFQVLDRVREKAPDVYAEEIAQDVSEALKDVRSKKSKA